MVFSTERNFGAAPSEKVAPDALRSLAYKLPGAGTSTAYFRSFIDVVEMLETLVIKLQVGDQRRLKNVIWLSYGDNITRQGFLRIVDHLGGGEERC